MNMLDEKAGIKVTIRKLDTVFVALLTLLIICGSISCTRTREPGKLSAGFLSDLESLTNKIQMVEGEYPQKLASQLEAFYTEQQRWPKDQAELMEYSNSKANSDFNITHYRSIQFVTQTDRGLALEYLTSWGGHVEMILPVPEGGTTKLR